MARQTILSVLGKILNLLVQESDSLLGFEDQFQWIEAQLRKYADLSKRMWSTYELIDIMYDIEDFIDGLIIRSAQRRSAEAIIRCVLSLVDLPRQFFYVLALIDLTDSYRFYKKLELIKVKIPRTFRKLCGGGGSWHDTFSPYDLEIGTTIVSPVISKFEALATKRQLRPAVRKQARWLRDEFKSLKVFLKDLESRQTLSEMGIAWTEELCDVCRSTENVVGLFLTKNERNPKSLFWSPRNFISQRNIAQQMARIQVIVSDISERTHEAIDQTTWIWDGYPSITPPATPEQLDIDMVSFEEDVDAVIKQLLKDDPRCLTISIVGVKGIGKTNLAKLICDSQGILDNFPHRNWVSGLSYYEIMEAILSLHNKERPKPVGNESYTNRLREMVNNLLLDKKCLIVVDGSNASEFWREMGTAFRDISNGTRIIFLVDRLSKAPPVTETNSAYRLHLRSNDESWALFTHALKIKIPPELEQNLKKHILRKCGGLPKVIVKLAELLSHREATLEEWSTALDQLNQDEEPWSTVLEEINKYLPLYLRRCLFYFGLFPVGYKVPARRLMALWVAEGLGRQKNDDNSPEDAAEACLRELISYNMVQVTERKPNGKVKTCCLPEALRVHWFAKAKEGNFLRGHNETNCAIRRVADHLDQKDPIFEHIHGNNTTSFNSWRDTVTFISFDTREGSRAGQDIGNFLDRCISSNCFHFLWVLDLENVYKPKLPKAVGQLFHLRYLGLRSTYLEMLPMFIDKLLNLQTLDLKRTCIDTLPTSIWKMQKLRHLFLDESFCSSSFPPQEPNSLMALQTFSGVFIDENSPVNDGLDSLLGIRKLALKCKLSVPSQKAAMSLQLFNIADWVVNLKHLQSLRLKSFDESGQPWDLHLQALSGNAELSDKYLVGKLKNQDLISKFPQSLTELTLSASGLIDDPMQSLDKLPNLRIVRLFSRSFSGKKMLCKDGGFPKLEVLKLWELELLEEWNMEKGAMPSLKHLEIRRCINLKMLPDALRCIDTLREVKLIKVPMLSSTLKDDKMRIWIKLRILWEEDWALRFASSDQFRKCMLPQPDPGHSYAKFMDDYISKIAEGYNVSLEPVIEEASIVLGQSCKAAANRIVPDAVVLHDAAYFFSIFKRLFADLILSFQDIESSRSFFQHEHMTWEKTFKVIEFELGFMYDLLYTKASVIHTYLGSFLRTISLSLTVFTLLAFFQIDKPSYSRIDKSITCVFACCCYCFTSIRDAYTTFL
ncbi:hypothetical protein JCGZ_20877 [Jatropha curcas]|uniref:NB-ARC domain-containing protein n=1 Tax=Jatropha curcas TaxID=180498 RepID=A0A067L630_JATCU|nr:hypothetical protein JCGZ_20877 [Jatropha curcas]